MLLRATLYHILVSIPFVGLASYFYSLHYGLSVAAGCLLIGLNLIALIWSWQLIFFKKSVALAVGVIVFKYAILGVIIFQVIISGTLETMGFFVGLLSLLPSVGLVALTEHKKFLNLNNDRFEANGSF